MELTWDGGARASVMVVHKDTTASTIDDMRAFIAAEATPFPATLDAVIIIARTQTAGRGSGTRKWASSIPGNLYCNIALPLARVPAGLMRLFQIVLAVALRRVLSAYAPLHTKWPNDVLALDGRKLAGVLIECCQGVISVGVGVNIVEAPDAAAIREGGRPAVALAELLTSGTPPPAPEDVALALCRELLGLARKGDAQQQCEALLAEYREGVDWTVPVYERAAPTVPLVALGITNEGHLQVRRPDGTTDVLVDRYLV